MTALSNVANKQIMPFTIGNKSDARGQANKIRMTGNLFEKSIRGRPSPYQTIKTKGLPLALLLLGGLLPSI